MDDDKGGKTAILALLYTQQQQLIKEVGQMATKADVDAAVAAVGTAADALIAKNAALVAENTTLTAQLAAAITPADMDPDVAALGDTTGKLNTAAQ